ncbi:uncharacterized protein ACO6RY_04934 [Pungitius sinensis]
MQWFFWGGLFELTQIVEYKSWAKWPSWRFQDAHGCHYKPQRPISVSPTAGKCRLVHGSDLLTLTHGRHLNAVLFKMIKQEKKLTSKWPTVRVQQHINQPITAGQPFDENF